MARSTTKTNFPSAAEAVRAGDQEQLEKLQGIAKGARAAGRQLSKALKENDPVLVEDAMYMLSSTGNCVNSWSK